MSAPRKTRLHHDTRALHGVRVMVPVRYEVRENLLLEEAVRDNSVIRASRVRSCIRDSEGAAGSFGGSSDIHCKYSRDNHRRHSIGRGGRAFHPLRAAVDRRQKGFHEG